MKLLIFSILASLVSCELSIASLSTSFTGPVDATIGLFPSQSYGLLFSGGNWDKDTDIKIDLVGSFSGTAYLTTYSSGPVLLLASHFQSSGFTTIFHNVNLHLDGVNNGFAGVFALYLTSDTLDGGPQGLNISKLGRTTQTEGFLPVSDIRPVEANCQNTVPGYCLVPPASFSNSILNANGALLDPNEFPYGGGLPHIEFSPSEEVVVTPEPKAWLPLALGIAGLTLVVRKRRAVRSSSRPVEAR